MDFLYRHRFLLLCAAGLALILLGVLALFPREAGNDSGSAGPLAATEIAEMSPSASPPSDEGASPAGSAKADADFSKADAAFGKLRGRVIDAATGRPVREFVIEFQGHRQTKLGYESPGARRFTSADGRFEWDYVLPGQWTLTADASDYQRFQLERLQITAGQTPAEIVMPLRRGYRVRGRVYDAATGAGIPSATISFRESHLYRYEGNFRIRPLFTSDKSGAFELKGVPAGAVTLSVSAAEHAPREVSISVDSNTASVDVALSAGASITGKLTAADGQTPVTGEVGIFNVEEGVGVEMPTSAAGEFHFNRLSPGLYRLSGRTAAGASQRDIVITGNERVEGLILSIETGSSVRGVVTGLSPEELKRLSIVAHGIDNDMPSLSVIQPDAQGAFALRGVKSGRLNLIARVEGSRELSRTIDVPAGTVTTVNLEFPRGARLWGRVTLNGKPLTDMHVEPRLADDQRGIAIQGGRTSADGRYEFEGLGAGEYRIRIGSYTSDVIHVSGDTRFDIDVPELERISGRVLEEGASVPVVGALVQIAPAESDKRRGGMQVSSDHFGQFRMDLARPGDFTLTVYKPGYELFRERVSYSSAPADLAITLRRDAGVEIHAYTADNGNPVHRMSATEYPTGLWIQIPLDMEGRGHLPRAFAGSTLTFLTGTHEPVVIRNWDGLPFTLRFPPRAASQGQ